MPQSVPIARAVRYKVKVGLAWADYRWTEESVEVFYVGHPPEGWVQADATERWVEQNPNKQPLHIWATGWETEEIPLLSDRVQT